MKIDGYEILEKIGQGGMAQVYKGYQISLKRPVAVKVLTNKFIDQADFIQRFEKESLIIARLSNPYIIPVIERGITNEGVPFFIMEYVEGHELSDVMSKGELDFNRKLDIITQVCKALSYAHRNNVIHRDIKPANIFLDSDGNARVLDFGIAQYYEDNSSTETEEHTKIGTVMGTMAYMSPEQRQSSTNVTSKSDLFSLGVLMYKLFTHQDPIGRFKAPDELSTEIPHDLSELILQCLETDPDCRPASADDIKDTLLLLLRGAHIQTEKREQVQKDFKQFELLDVIKEDNHSSVLLFENRSNAKLIVIKKRTLHDAGFTEAKLLTPLKHPNIVNILGTSENKRHYIIVMEYLNGGNLQDRLAQAIDWQDFIPSGKQIASGMQFAHQNRILHGNLRPSNILFNNNGQIKLADFGLEEHYSKDAHVQNWYRLGVEKVTPLLDIFSVGVIYYHMLTGIPPVLEDQRYETHKKFRKLPLKLKQLIAQMIAIEPKQRTENFSSVLNQLGEISSESGETIVLRPKKKAQKKVKRLSRSTRRFFTLLVLFILLAAAVYFFVDMSEVQYFIDDLFFSSGEGPEDVPNFIEIN
ncbi:MAG: protein kinase [Gammaproteobacteria bacterium]|nr:protein kinase [Gammaproteobacteria bacterium]